MTDAVALYVAACPAENMQTDGSCTATVWMPYPQPILPPLDLADGSLVAFSIVGVWAVAYKAKLVFKAARVGANF